MSSSIGNTLTEALTQPINDKLQRVAESDAGAGYETSEATEAGLKTYARNLATTPKLAWTFAGLLIGSVPFAFKRHPALPPFWQLTGFGAIFGGSGYILHAGDPMNGAGTTTAWSLSYLFLHLRSSLRSGRPLPVLLTTMAGINAGVYGSYYFGRGYRGQSERVA